MPPTGTPTYPATSAGYGAPPGTVVPSVHSTVPAVHPEASSHLPYPKVDPTDSFKPALDPVAGGTYTDRATKAVTSSATYVKQKTMAGVTTLQEKDWTKEKEMAGKAATSTLNAAAAGGSWLSNKAKQAASKVNEMRANNAATKPTSKPDGPAPL